MSKKIAFIFPGQGAQYPSMGKDFYEQFPIAREVFLEADSLLGYSFSKLIFEGSAEELMQTKNSQLAIFIVSMAILKVLQQKYPDLKPTVCAGLSLGEYSALVAAGKISFQEALLVVKARGLYMQEASETNPGTMNVVLGLEPAKVEEVIQPYEGVWVANLNCPGQVVIAGTKEDLEKVAPLLKEKGAKRVLPLDVSGAFHSGLMQPAQDKLAPMIDDVLLVDSPILIAMNAAGRLIEDSSEMRENMVRQVTEPVRWEACIRSMLNLEIDLFIEMGPGKTLAGMNKRIGVTDPTYSIEKVEDLSTLGAIYATHG